jgi:preprotein translocase subunit SecE
MDRVKNLLKKKNKAKKIKADDTLPKTSILGELKQVTWTKPKDLVMLVIYVLILCGAVSALMMGLDLFFGGLRELVL